MGGAKGGVFQERVEISSILVTTFGGLLSKVLEVTQSQVHDRNKSVRCGNLFTFKDFFTLLFERQIDRE